MLWPGTATAHLVTTGMGPVYDGIGHLLLTPEDIIPVVALALFGGMRGAESCRKLLMIVPLCWLLGGITGFGGTNIPDFPVQAGSLLLIGLLVAGDVRLPVPVTVGIAGLFGLLHGFMNGVTLNNELEPLGLLGITIALIVIITIVSALVVSIAGGWKRVAVRVGGSWVAASGLLMFGWYLKGV
ncbi:HupE/UreJ family protein [Desulfosediminicola sp.]|uniref:HupE/UreJ family protein n=1 Tax=Desulfosediminicola sp. TaxID=2886825 RepID=UPI003AF2006C